MPSDVFYQLRSEDKSLEGHLSVYKRVSAEAKLRKSRLVMGQSGEVRLEEIYANIFPNSNEATIASLVKNEISLEKQGCSIFEPICDLLLSAKKRA